MITAGIDAGSRSIKIALWDQDRQAVIGLGKLDQGIDQSGLARRLFEQLLETHSLAPTQVTRIVATGYGRHRVDFASTTITEITCHARGVRHSAPEVRTIVEIGGQDSKLIRLDPDGTVRDFAMNDRCAAGTGRFLEMVATRLAVSLEQLSALAQESRNPSLISSTCVVFAETEIVGLLASAARPEDIVAGIQTAVAKRVAAMAGRMVESPVLFTGGVALVPSMVNALQAALGVPVQPAQQPLFTGALGAAILAARPIPL